MSAKFDTKDIRASERSATSQVEMVTGRVRLRQWWLNLHLWIGLVVGFLFVLLGLTGSINVFRNGIDALLNPELQIAKPQSEYRSLDEMVQAAHAAYPDCEGIWSLQLPGIVSPMALVRCNETPTKGFFTLQMMWVDPSTAEVVSSRSFGDFFITWIYNLHWSLLMGKSGHIFVGFLGLLLMISLGTGIYLWWPSPRGWKRALTIKRNASSERLIFDLHKTFGLYAALVLFILAFSGTYMVFPDYIKPLVNGVSTITSEPQKVESVPLPGRVPIRVDEAVAAAKEVFPDGEPKWINLPEGSKGVYQVRMRRADESLYEWFTKTYGASAVMIDQYSGQVLAVRDSNQLSAGDEFVGVQWAFHSGEALGLPGRILWCLIGLVPLVLYVTGIIRWLQKRRARNNKISVAN